MQTVRGFTILESIIYVALTAFLLGSVLVSVHPILSGAGRTADKISADAETAFVVQKIQWAMLSATTVSVPNAGTLSVAGPYGTLVFTNTGGILYLVTNGSAPVALTASRVAFTNLTFTTVAHPSAIDMSFSVNGNGIGPLRMYVRPQN